jgi:hypothetical protein
MAQPGCGPGHKLGHGHTYTGARDLLIRAVKLTINISSPYFCRV